MGIESVGNAGQQIYATSLGQQTYAAFKPSGATKGAGAVYNRVARELTDALVMHNNMQSTASMMYKMGPRSGAKGLRANARMFLEQCYKQVGLPFDAKAAKKLSPVETAKLFAKQLNTKSLKELHRLTQLTPEKIIMGKASRYYMPEMTTCLKRNMLDKLNTTAKALTKKENLQLLENVRKQIAKMLYRV